MTTTRNFLLPKSRQFPFDELMSELVSELKYRNLHFPGLRIKFHDYELGRYVNTIEGEDFRLGFCRVQGRQGNFNDIAAVNELIIPGKELRVYEDNSGPTLYTYVGKNWESDKDNFLHGTKVKNKLYRKPRTYLKYKGAWTSEGRAKLFGGALILQQPFETGIAPYLVHDNDIGREYDLEKGDPPFYRTSEVFEEFTKFFSDKVEEIKAA